MPEQPPARYRSWLTALTGVAALPAWPGMAWLMNQMGPTSLPRGPASGYRDSTFGQMQADPRVDQQVGASWRLTRRQP
jgi:hypothetical protein